MRTTKKDILSLLLAVFVCCILTSCGADDAIDQAVNILQSEDPHIAFVKGGAPVSYPDKTYGEAFEGFFGSPTWKYFEGSNEDSEEVLDVVEFTGYCTYHDVEVKALVQFTLDVEAGTFETTYLSFNEVPQTNLMLLALIDAAFTNSAIEEDASGGADTTDTTDTSTSTEPDSIKDTTVAGPSPDAPYLGDYEMLSEDENMGATLSIFYSLDDSQVYLEGFANFYDHAGDVYGEVRIVDSSHFYYEDSGNRLDILYDESSDTLTVKETGIFGGVGVTFEGVYEKELIGPTATDDDSYPYLIEFAGLMCSDPSALWSEDKDERNAFLQSAKEGYDQWVAGTDYHYIVIDDTGHLAIDYDIAAAEGIVGLW